MYNYLVKKYKEIHNKIWTNRKKKTPDTVFLGYFDNLSIAWNCNWFYQDFQCIVSTKVRKYSTKTIVRLSHILIRYWEKYLLLKVDIVIEKMILSWHDAIVLLAMGPFVFIIWIMLPITGTHAKYKCFIEDYIFFILVY